jgi:hypothetical protein
MKEGKNMLEFSIITITAFVATLNECVKLLADTAFNKNIDKFIPLFSIAFGIILGIVGYFLPNVDMGKNIVEAIFIGLSAGMASTGAHQVGKQLSKE